MNDEQVRSEFRQLHGLRRRWFDRLLRALCFVGWHRWYYFSALAKPAGSEYRRVEWYECRLCGLEGTTGWIQPKKPWPRHDQ